PETAVVEVGGVQLYLLHDVKQLDFDVAATDFTAVVSGHSHRPSSEIRGGVLYFNPGSAGPRRFRLPIAVGKLIVRGGKLDGENDLVGRERDATSPRELDERAGWAVADDRQPGCVWRLAADGRSRDELDEDEHGQLFLRHPYCAPRRGLSVTIVAPQPPSPSR